MKKGALNGIRVADFSWVWAGPLATMLLSFLGAEVIKIESRKRIDQTRHSSITTGDTFASYDASPIFNNANLNKKGVTLDLSSPEGAELARQIVATSDLVLENMRPGVMERLGLGYKDLVKVKPDIVMASSSGFGSSGPYRSYAGYAPIFAAFGGLANLTGYEDGEPNTMTGEMDLRVGTATAFILLAALLHRQKTGEGQYIDLSSTECVTALVGDQLMAYAMNEKSPSRRGNQDDFMAPHNCYRCKGHDKWVSIAVATDEEWKTLRTIMGNPAWSANENFATVSDRWENRAALDEHMATWTLRHEHYEITDALQSAGIAAMPSLSAEELLNDPHVKARNMITEVQHPTMGRKVVVSPPWKLSETPATIRGASPLLGEHNAEIFGGLLGMPQEEIARLEREKIIY